MEIKESVGMLPSIKKKVNVKMPTPRKKVITPIRISLLIQSECELNSSCLLKERERRAVWCSLTITRAY